MSRFTSGEPESPQTCARYADAIALLDEPAPETPERIAARVHLAECQHCLRERQTLAEASAALDRRLQALMTQAPTFTEEQIATRAALFRRAGDTASADGRREAPAALRTRPATSAQGKRSAPSSAPPHAWRRALSAIGGAAAMVAIIALLVTTLTGHLLGRLPSRQGTSPSATAVSLNAMTVYAPCTNLWGRQPNELPGLVAFRASDGVVEHVYPSTPVAEGAQAAVFSQGIVYRLTLPGLTADPTATLPATLSATRISDHTPLWSVRTDAIYTSSLLLVNGVLYLGTWWDSTGAFDPHIHAIYAFSASDGALRWKHNLASQPNGPPVARDGVIYVFAGQTALALRASDGVTIWQAPTPTSGQQIISAWQTVANGVLYAYVSLDTPNGQKDDFGVEVFALRLSDGATLWHVRLGTDIFPSQGPFAPVVADGVVYVRLAPVKFTTDQYPLQLFALRATDGATLWRYTSTHGDTGQKGIPNIYPPAVANDVVYVTEDGGDLTALSASDGHMLWSVNVDKTPGQDTYPYSIQSPAVAGGAVFVISDHTLVAVSARDGAPLWQAGCGVMPGQEGTAPQIVVEPRG
ncbi:MAG TPA: PQQ-binding-like beta-propeller repeat protein [Ktedonobacterales bacterium]|nr:PQQ-binding-like beta-propeller repeat protein [Ktedonobacterales bacterium]